ncbi:MAG TPA: hypothetical protein PLN80_09515, partial [Anaerolineaceae bacterium]|nr:hypothetical protein [Anaerolineaceae bacterium]
TLSATPTEPTLDPTPISTNVPADPASPTPVPTRAPVTGAGDPSLVLLLLGGLSGLASLISYVLWKRLGD